MILAALLVAAGCGKNQQNRGAVGGEVKLDGKPLERGSILFTPIEGAKGTVAGSEIENGRYRLSAEVGPALGFNRVEIRSLRKSGKMARAPMGPPGEMAEGYEEALPPRYHSASTLKAEIKPGDNTLDFELSTR